MKIQCDVCSKNQASLFCTADEAALCDGCDHRVHHANKLASKHQRFSLYHPSSHQFPLCDVCQEKRAFVFCQQDRAILCKECDPPIHSANDHTKKHSRFLLTGIKLSASASASAATPRPSSPSNPKNPVTSQPQTLAVAKDVPSTVSEPPNINNKLGAGAGAGAGAGVGAGAAGGSMVGNEEGAGGFTGSISDYLMKTIPGWQVEDFLDSPSVPFGFSKVSNDGGDDYMLRMFDAGDFAGNLGSSLSAKSMGGIWVPQAPSSLYSAQMGQQIPQREAMEVNNNIKGSSRSRLLETGDDNNFIVPQMSPVTNNNIASKRPRLLL